MVPDGSPLRDLIHTPQIQPHTVQQCHDSDYSEPPCRVQREAVAEVEKGSGDGTKVDGEFEPGKEGPLGGEVNLGLNTDGDENTCYLLVVYQDQ